MYLGRILSVGMTTDGKPFVAYRVSSRSFPNRQAKKGEGEAAIIPKEGFETDIFKNTYIAYNCIKIVGDTAIVSNGSHTDVIADKISLGMSIKDALGYSLLTMDYEKDDYNTPRIAAVINCACSENDYECYVGIVTDEKLLVEKVGFGEAVFISTYECNNPEIVKFSAENADEAAQLIFDGGAFEEFEKPVTSAASVYDGKWDISVLTP